MMTKIPNELLNVTYCDKCGRDDRIHPLSKRHFSAGEACIGGKLKIVTYRRDDATIRDVREPEEGE